MAGALRTLCVPSGRRHSAKLLLGRPGRFLSGYPERPPLYLGLRCARAARRANGALSHCAWPAADDRAVSVIHRGRGLARFPVRSLFYLYATVASLSGYSRLLRAIRADVMRALEAAREARKIGSSLQAHVEVRACGARYQALAGLGDDLKFMLITSAATVIEARCPDEEGVTVTPSPHPKCARCWHYRADVGADSAHPALCGRCIQNLFGAGEKDRMRV